MQITIPYSSGWKAYVDGEEQHIINSNDMYMAIEIPAGKHHVSLRYKTKGITAGFMATSVGIIALASYYVIKRRRIKVKRKEE